METEHPHDEACETELNARVAPLLAALGIAPSVMIYAEVTDYSSLEYRRETPWTASFTTIGNERLYEITDHRTGLVEHGTSARAVTDALLASITARVGKLREATAAALLKAAADATAWDAASKAWSR